MDTTELFNYARLFLALIACFLIKRAIDLRNKHLQLMHDIKLEELRSIKVNCETYITRQRALEDKAFQIKSECLSSIANLSERLNGLISESEARLLELENKKQPAAAAKRPAAAAAKRPATKRHAAIKNQNSEY